MNLIDKIAAEVLGPLVEKLEPIVVAKLIESLDGRTAQVQLEGYEITLLGGREEGRGTMTEQQIPEDATFWPAAQGGPTPPGETTAVGYQHEILDQTFRFASKVNEIALFNYNTSCANYIVTRMTRPDLAVAKPSQPVSVEVHFAWTKPGTKDILDPATASGSADLYTWTRPGVLLGMPVVDPVPPPPPPGNVHVGQMLWPGFYRSMPDDTAPSGTEAVAPDGTPVVKQCSPFGCVYVKRG